MNPEPWLPLIFILLGFLGVSMHSRVSGSSDSDTVFGNGLRPNALRPNLDPSQDQADSDSWPPIK